MRSRVILDAWLKFWFAPQSPVPVAVFRIVFGLLVLDAALFHIGPDVLDWLGLHGIVRPNTVHQYWWWNDPRFDIFLVASNDAAVLLLWKIFVGAIVCLTIGLWTRASAIVVALYLISIDNRQPFAINGGDAMMRTLAGYIMFTEAGAALSVDRLIARFRNPTFGEASRPLPAAPFGQRLIQVQVAIAYWSTFCAKASGAQWLDGTAVYYATRLDDMINHTMFLYNQLWFCKLLSWYTLVVEGAMFTLVWVRDLRYVILVATVILHIGIDYSLNLPVFEYVFISSLICFIYPEDLTKWMDYLKARIQLRFGSPAALIFNPAIPLQCSFASVIEGLDIFGRIRFVAQESSTQTERLMVVSDRGTLKGFALFCWLTSRLPLLWPIFPITGLLRMLNPKSEMQSKTQSQPDTANHP